MMTSTVFALSFAARGNMKFSAFKDFCLQLEIFSEVRSAAIPSTNWVCVHGAVSRSASQLPYPALT